MPTREEIMALVRRLLDEWVGSYDEIWVALYRLLMTDSNRLKKGAWRQRALQVQEELAKALNCSPQEVSRKVDVFVREMYETGTQKMNPVGIAFACAIVYLVRRFAAGQYNWKMEAKIGVDVFPRLTGFRRQSVDIVAFQQEQPYAVVPSKWGIRHDRVRDLQEEADTYKREVSSLKFFVVTNEFDNARLQKVLTYPTIDGVFHVRRDLVWQVYGGITDELSQLKDLTELFPPFRKTFILNAPSAPASAHPARRFPPLTAREAETGSGSQSVRRKRNGFSRVGDIDTYPSYGSHLPLRRHDERLAILAG